MVVFSIEKKIELKRLYLKKLLLKQQHLIMESWYVTIPIQRVKDTGSSDRIMPIRDEEIAVGEDFSDIDCHHSSSQHSLHQQCNTVSDIIDYTGGSCTSSISSISERFIPIHVESAELFVGETEVCLEGEAASGQEEEEEAGSWKTIPAVSSSSAGGQESETSSSAAFEPLSVQVSQIKPGGEFEALKEEMLGRKPPSGARTAPLPR